MAFYRFFDPDLPADVALLPSDVRADDDLGTMVELVERDVVALFTVRTSDTTFEVLLTGWDDDAPASSTADLMEELRHTIARVVGHRLQQKSRNTSVSRIKLADWEAEFGGDTSSVGVLWPPAWDSALDRLYGERAPWFHV